MHIQSLFHYQQWTGTWRSKFEQKTNSVLLACWSKRWKSQRPWIYWFLCTTSRAIHAQCMEETSRRGILGRYWSCDQRRIDILSNKIECNYSSRNTLSPLYFKSRKIENWREVVWKTIFCLLDHHQRSLWNTITIGLKEMINRVLQLNISQLENSFNSHLEKHFKLVLPSQPNPNQLMIERRNLWPKIVGKSQGELGSSDRTEKPVKDEDNRVMSDHDRTGKPVEESSHKVQEVWFSRTSWYYIVKREQVQPCDWWRKHRFQHLGRTECDGETITWY